MLNIGSGKEAVYRNDHEVHHRTGKVDGRLAGAVAALQAEQAVAEPVAERQDYAAEEAVEATRRVA